MCNVCVYVHTVFPAFFAVRLWLGVRARVRLSTGAHVQPCTRALARFAPSLSWGHERGSGEGASWLATWLVG